MFSVLALWENENLKKICFCDARYEFIDIQFYTTSIMALSSVDFNYVRIFLIQKLRN